MSTSSPDATEFIAADRRVRRLDPVVDRLETLVDEVGRLRRVLHLGPAERVPDLLDRLTDHVEGLRVMLTPTAAERVQAGLPVERALAEVDAEANAVRRRLGLEPPR